MYVDGTILSLNLRNLEKQKVQACKFKQINDEVW